MPDRLTLPAGSRVKKKNLIVGVAGRKGLGKSEVVRDIGEKCPRWFHYDTMGEHLWIPDRFVDLSEAEWFLLDASETKATFHASMIAGDDLEPELNSLSSTVFDAGNLTLCVEEIPMMSGPGHAPKKFMKVVRTGRHVNVNVIYTCQRLSEVPVTLRSATDFFVLFQHTEPLDLSAISDRCGSDMARDVSRLSEHDFLVWDVTTRKLVAYQEFVGVVLPRFQNR